VIFLLAATLLTTAPSEAYLLAELEYLERELVEAELKIKDAETQRSKVEAEIASVSAELSGVRVRKNEAEAKLRRRLHALEKMPAGARLVLIGGSSSLGEYLEQARVLRWTAHHDKAIREQYVAAVAEFEQLEAKVSKNRETIEKLTNLARANRDSIAARRVKRETLLREMLEDKGSHQTIAKQYGGARRELAGTIMRLEGGDKAARTFAASKGRLPWPSAGKVTARFGQRIELTFGTTTIHSGIDIRAAATSPVQAIAPGKVAYAGWLRGYGLTIIVDHGEGFHAVMAHLASVNVEVGAEVQEATRVGTVGDTGSLRGALLYFELRKDGHPIDPARWLR
jgi:septal ring factor EnvC (AmiA/AmiB activator)